MNGLSTYAITQRTPGGELTRGFILAVTLDDALVRAWDTFGPAASARLAEGEGETIRSIDDLVYAENDLTLARMRAA